MNEENEKRRFVRRRTLNEGSVTRPRKLQIRATVAVSNEVASIQGLIFKYGHKETLADIFESVLLPRLKEYVRPYVDMARADREAALKAIQGELGI
jgi:hypothetical protein